MEKIKVNMTNGSSVEKPLVTAFNGNGGSFVVFDNEATGTMGLPIILVSKLENGRLVMINDAEWTGVKEILRMIIGGNQIDYIKVDASISADDTFYKQLTLPVASFDILKNSYKPVESSVSAPVQEVTPEVAPVMPDAPEMAPMPEVVEAAPAVESAPIPAAQEPSVSEPVIEDTPAMPTESIPNPEVVAPVQEEVPVQEVTPEVAPVMPDVPPVPEVVETVPAVESAPMPTVEPIPEVVEPTPSVDLTADKEAFMKACENMFDALVAKLKN